METGDIYFWKLEGKQPVPCADIYDWAEWMASTDRQLALDVQDAIMVSTVFIGTMHIAFETMTFNEGHPVDCIRTSTYDAALAAHEEMTLKHLGFRSVLDAAEIH